MRKLRVGVVGVGSLGETHARIYASLPEVELVGVFDSNPERCGEIAAKHCTRAYDRMEDLAGDVEAASVVVPTNHHHPVFSALAERGLHCLVEKPIATTTAEAEDMLRLARKKGIVLQVGHVERFNPVMKFLEENLVGPRFIEATRLAPYPPPRPGAPPRGTEVSVVLDLMIHDLDIILHLVSSEPVEVHAVGVNVLSPTEDIANARIRFSNGCVANVTASRVSRDRQRKIRVFCEDSYLSLDYISQGGQLIRKATGGMEAIEVPITKSEPLMEELRSFARCAMDRRDPVVTGDHASRALDLAVEICRQIRHSPS